MNPNGRTADREQAPLMMLSDEDVDRIAQLSRLAISAQEREQLREQLNGFFGIVEAMRSVDTRGVEPLYTPLSAVQAATLRLREDIVTEAVERERLQRGAPSVASGLYLVPRVIE